MSPAIRESPESHPIGGLVLTVAGARVMIPPRTGADIVNADGGAGRIRAGNRGRAARHVRFGRANASLSSFTWR